MFAALLGILLDLLESFGSAGVLTGTDVQNVVHSDDIT